MKNYLTRNRIRHLPFLTCLLWLLCFNSLNAQINLTWDSESGCQIYKPGERKDFIEDIQPGDCVRVCENSKVTYTLTGSNPSWPAVWTVTGGAITSSNNTSCTVAWGNSGWGFVSVTVTTPSGPRVQEMCLEIIDGPRAQFTIFPHDPGVNEYKACLLEELYFTNLSNDGGGSEIVSYFWDFGDHNYSSEFEPSHTYTQPGDYEIILTVTNACNCTSEIRKKIHIMDVKAFEISCNSVVCENGSDTYSLPKEIAERCNKFNWKVEGGTITSSMPYGPNIDVTWDHVDSTGFGYVTFDASECGFPCSAVTIKVPVVLSKGTIVGDAVVCANDQYRYKLPQWPTTDFVWSIVANGTGASIINTDQRNEVIVQTGSAGNITLRCTYTNTMLKCGGYAEFDIRVRPVGVVTGPKAICQNTSATYTMGSGFIASWTLKRPNNTIATGSGNTFTSLFTIPGKYTLTVTGNDFCQPESPFVIRVDKIPTPPLASAIVGPNKICVSTPVEYSLVNTEPGTVLVWSVTNGVISGSNYGTEITVEFNPGFPSYTISVRRENTADPHCQSAAATKTVVPHQVTPLSISGPVNNICPSSVTNYSASYLEGETYEWTVNPPGAGSISAGQGTAFANVQWNQIPIAGTSVNVKVRKCNVTYPASLAVTVTPIPVLTINGVPASICPNNSITPSLSGSPALTSGSVVWDFGDNTPTETTPVGSLPLPHNYGNPTVNTSYTITATVINPNGCLSPIAVTKTFTVMPAPVAFISPDTDRYFCGTVTPFTLTATVNLPFDTIKWYKDGLLVSGATTVNLPVSTFGSYNAYVANANGCGAWTNTINVINSCGAGCTITPPPSVAMNAVQTGCTSVTATASTSPAPFSYSWSISNQGSFVGTPTATNANIEYSKAGLHTVIYYATYQLPGGGLCTVPKYSTVIIPYIPKVKYDIVCSATPGKYDIIIYDYSQYYPSAPADTKTFIVNGNNYPVPVGQPSYTLTAVSGGNYNIGVQLTKAGYPTCSHFLNETLPPLAPVTIAGPTAACDGTGFSFTSSLAPAPGLFFQWNFGDGTFNANPTPTKIYNTPGTYTVTLNVYTVFGCSVQDTHTVVVNANTLGGNLTSTSPNCEGDPIIITFNNTGTSPFPSLYTWMKDTSVVGTTPGPTFAVNDSGAYWVTLTNSNGCTKHLATTNAKFIMTPDPVVEGPDSVCLGTAFELSGYAGGGTLQYRWLRNNVEVAPWSSSAMLNYTSNVVGAATFKVEVRVPDGSGGYCVSSAPYVVTTYSNPPTPSITFNVSNCNPYTVNLSATTGTPGTYTWSNGMSGANITTNEGGPFMVTFTNPGGCTSSFQVDVPKDPEVYFWIFPTGCYEFCIDKESQNGPFPILGPAPTISFNKWQWFKDYSIDQFGNGVVPNYTISQSGIYQMGLNNGYCGKTTDEMEVTITDCKCPVKYDIKEIRTDYKPFCHYIFDMYIDNPYGYPIVVNIGTNNGSGIFQPGAVTVPPGGGNFTISFIPITFTGGSLEITLTTTNEKGDMCKGIEKWNFPTCRQLSREGDEDDTNMMDNGFAKNINSLVVSPNPTDNATGLTYTFANEKAQVRTIEIYTLMGVLLEKYTPETQSGVWNVSLGRYAAGQYIVVMREDGMALAQKAIIVK